jgi:hypothetical protein
MIQVLQRLRSGQARHGGIDDRAGGKQDQHPLHAAREVLGLVVSVSVAVVRGAGGDRQCPERDHAGGEVDECLQGIRQQADRAGEEIGPELEPQRDQRGRDRKQRHAPGRLQVHPAHESERPAIAASPSGI